MNNKEWIKYKDTVKRVVKSFGISRFSERYRLLVKMVKCDIVSVMFTFDRTFGKSTVINAYWSILAHQEDVL